MLQFSQLGSWLEVNKTWQEPKQASELPEVHLAILQEEAIILIHFY